MYASLEKSQVEGLTPKEFKEAYPQYTLCDLSKNIPWDWAYWRVKVILNENKISKLIGVS